MCDNTNDNKMLVAEQVTGKRASYITIFFSGKCLIADA